MVDTYHSCRPYVEAIEGNEGEFSLSSLALVRIAGDVFSKYSDEGDVMNYVSSIVTHYLVASTGDFDPGLEKVLSDRPNIIENLERGNFSVERLRKVISRIQGMSSAMKDSKGSNHRDEFEERPLPHYVNSLTTVIEGYIELYFDERKHH